MHALAKGGEKLEGFLITEEKSLENILEQLNMRKDNLEKRLIENDTDSAIDRAKLLGELDGINYAISAVRKFC